MSMYFQIEEEEMKNKENVWITHERGELFFSSSYILNLLFSLLIMNI